jgi:hypothetical protein
LEKTINTSRIWNLQEGVGKQTYTLKYTDQLQTNLLVTQEAYKNILDAQVIMYHMYVMM